MDVQRTVKLFGVSFVLLMLIGLVSAQTEITNAVCVIYKGTRDLLPVFGFVLFVLAGVAYAAGQFFGAEMRAKATGWAMNMIVGALIAFILSILGPMLVEVFYPGFSIGTTCPG